MKIIKLTRKVTISGHHYTGRSPSEPYAQNQGDSLMKQVILFREEYCSAALKSEVLPYRQTRECS